MDASNIEVGGVLRQEHNKILEVLAFFSKKLGPSKTKYSTFFTKFLAIYLTIKHFRHYLEGNTFTVYTDQKPLITVLHFKTERSSRQTRQLEYIAQFTNTIIHIKGTDNKIADALSRCKVEELRTPNLDLKQLYKE